MKKIYVIIVAIIFLAIGAVGSMQDTWAEEEDEPWFGIGSDVIGGLGGGSGVDPGTKDCNTTRTKLSCLGYSWIFFEAVQGAPQVDVEFRPRHDYTGVAVPRIDAKCANTKKEGIGFWHLGRNAVSRGDDAWPVFISWYEEALHEKSKNKTDINRFLMDGPNSFGHMATYNYTILRNKYRWAKYRYRLSDFPDNISDAVRRGVEKGVDGAQSIYKKIDGKYYKIYESKYIASEEHVFNDFKKAWRKAYGTPYTGDSFPEDIYAFCYAPYVYELKAVAIDQNGNSLSSVAGLEDKIVKVKEKTLGSVTRGTSPRYEFLGWKLRPSDKDYITTTNTGAPRYVSGTATPKETLNISSLEDDLIVYAIYKESLSFRGQIKVNDAVTIGYTDQNGSKNYNINNCSPVNGCKVTFAHNLQRVSTSGSTNYRIRRTSNYWTGSVGVEPKNPLASGRENFTSSNSQRVYTDTIYIFPGQVVCETLTFNHRSSNDGEVNLTICVNALGSAQPEDPSDPNDPNRPEYDPNGNNNSGMFVDIEVRNNNVSKYNTYRRIVYAKPTDGLTYRASYNPVLQYTYYLKPQRLRINGGSVYPSTGINVNRFLKDIFNERKGSSLRNWNNAFTITSDGPGYNHNHIYNGGDSRKQVTANNYSVKTTDVGKELKETARTNVNANAQTTPSQVTFTVDSENRSVGNVTTANKTQSAFARVPYNFDTSAEIMTSAGEILDAGSSKRIDYKIGILPKINTETTNGSTDQAYATIVRNARSKIIIYTTNGNPLVGADYGNEDLCRYFANATNCRIDSENNYAELNREWNSGKGSFMTGQALVEIDDVEAGASVCVAVAFYPAHSGGNRNMNASGSKTWRISDSECYIVAKKPTFQVWGGGFYGGGNIATAQTVKKDGDKKIVFGSWAEYSVVSRGFAVGMASGAASGLALNNLGGGSLEKRENYCVHRVPLSLANYSKVLNICPVVPATGMSGVTAKRVTIEDFVRDVEKTENNVVISGKNIVAGETYIINTSGNVTIDNDIIYQSGNYVKFEEIPKAFIAANNIRIECNVKRIDAILIAKNRLDTCGGSDNNTRAGIDAENRSNQLVINGAIVASKLMLNRTYGAGVAAYSKIPAEIINYDTSILLWRHDASEIEGPGKTYQTYQHELAPRY